MRTRTWILLFAGLALVLLALALLLPRLGGGETARVWSDGKLVATLELNEPGVYTIYSAFSGGSNTVTVADGQVSVTAATCPDQVCVAHAAARPGSPVVCLPNRLIVSLDDAGEGDADAAVG